MQSEPTPRQGGVAIVTTAARPQAEAVCVRPTRDEDGPAIERLFERVFVGGAPARRRPAAVWSWLYRASPHGSWAFVAAREDGTVVAHYAGIPRRYVWQGDPVVAALGVDSMADPDARRGLGENRPFLATARAWFARHGAASASAFTYGLPNAAALRVGRRLLGYTAVWQPVRALFHRLCARREDDGFDVRPRADREVVAVRRFDDGVDALWQAVGSGLQLSAVRDRSYLNWRFADAPFEYRCLEVRAGGALRAIAVLRSRWCGAPILAIVDYLGAADDERSLDAVLRHAVAAAYAEELHRVELWLSPCSPLFAAALACGYETEPAPLSWCVRVHDPRLQLADLQQQWYFTIGDTDLF